MITFANLLTPEGLVIAGALISALVQITKRYLANIDGATQALIASAILYILAGIAVGVNSLDTGLTVFMAWLACASAAIATYEVVISKVATSDSNPKA